MSIGDAHVEEEIGAWAIDRRQGALVRVAGQGFGVGQGWGVRSTGMVGEDVAKELGAGASFGRVVTTGKGWEAVGDWVPVGGGEE
jgi:hypothetical protein